MPYLSNLKYFTVRYCVLVGLVAIVALSTASFAQELAPNRDELYDSEAGVWYKALGTRRHDVADSVYTTLSTASQYDPVGDVLFTEPAGTFRCSGTLISSTHVLTAAHCMDGGDAQGPATPSAINFFLPGVGLLLGDITKVDVHPAWNGNLTNGKDIAIFELTAPVNTVAPALRYDASFGSELGRRATSVGYGRTGTGLTGDTIASGTRRAGDNILDVFGSSFGWSSDLVMVDFDNPNDPNDNVLGSSIPLDIEYSTAPGDSGGGAFTNVAGTHYLTAVHSLGWSIDGNTNSDYGDGGGFTRVSVFNSWIDSIVVPEPSTAGLWMLGMLAGTVRRRK